MSHDQQNAHFFSRLSHDVTLAVIQLLMIMVLGLLLTTNQILRRKRLAQEQSGQDQEANATRKQIVALWLTLGTVLGVGSTIWSFLFWRH